MKAATGWQPPGGPVEIPWHQIDLSVTHIRGVIRLDGLHGNRGAYLTFELGDLLNAAGLGLGFVERETQA